MPKGKILLIAPESDGDLSDELNALGWTVLHCHDLDTAVDQLVSDDAYFIMICAEEAIDAQFRSGLDFIEWVRHPFGSSLQAILLQSVAADMSTGPERRLPPRTTCHRMDLTGMEGLLQLLSLSLYASMN